MKIQLLQDGIIIFTHECGEAPPPPPTPEYGPYKETADAATKLSTYIAAKQYYGFMQGFTPEPRIPARSEMWFMIDALTYGGKAQRFRMSLLDWNQGSNLSAKIHIINRNYDLVTPGTLGVVTNPRGWALGNNQGMWDSGPTSIGEKIVLAQVTETAGIITPVSFVWYYMG